jgi:hypothetical protein
MLYNLLLPAARRLRGVRLLLSFGSSVVKDRKIVGSSGNGTAILE